jgi:hypothetical protein
MQYGKTGSSEQKFITEKPVPQKIPNFCEQLDNVTTHIFGIQRSNQIRLEKGEKGPFSECCCPEIQQGRASLKRP